MKKYFERQKNQEDGITLIALTITIIVLIILAGISIGTVVGRDGLFTKTSDAKVRAKRSSLIEKAKLDVIDKELENADPLLYNDELKTILEKYFNDVPKEITLDTDLVAKEEFGGSTVTVREIYDGEIKTRGNTESEKISIADESLVAIEEATNSVYDGNEHKWIPTLTKKSDNKTLENNKDYTCSYNTENFIDVQTITVTIEGIGEYTGTITGFAEGETYSFYVTGSQTEVGSSKNTYHLDWSATAKENNYYIKLENTGTLTVTEQTIDPLELTIPATSD